MRNVRCSRSWLLLGCVLFTFPRNGVANTLTQSLDAIHDIRIASLEAQTRLNNADPPLSTVEINGELDRIRREESRDIRIEQAENLRELRNLDRNYPGWAGAVRFADLSPVSSIVGGDTGLLTFLWIAPATGQPVSGPAIGSVAYVVNDDPTVDIFHMIGISTAAATEFAMPYAVSGFEPLIIGVPYDLNGQPFVFPGVDGDNNAPGFVVNIPDVTVPEPPEFVLFFSGLVYLGFWRQRRANSPKKAKTAKSEGACDGSEMLGFGDAPVGHQVGASG